jgi:hypothetical protein
MRLEKFEDGAYSAPVQEPGRVSGRGNYSLIARWVFTTIIFFLRCGLAGVGIEW